MPVPAGPLVAASLQVSATGSGTIPARYMGLSYEKTTMSYGYFHASNHHLIALFKLLGPGVLRIGGGSVDRLLWTSEKQGTHLQVTRQNIKALAGFLEATGWQCLYAVNFARSTPELASEEVAYAASVLGANLLGIEIGNEPDEYGVAGNFFAGNWNYLDYLARWEMFRAAIDQTAPGVSITGPACGGGNHITTWTLPFGEAMAASGVTLLTQHYYRLSGASPLATADFLITADSQLTGQLTTLSQGAQRLGLPYRLSECNSFANGGAIGVSNSYASSLWAIDFLFTAAQFGASGVNMHGGGNGPGYTPIADDSGAVLDVRPEYYGLLFFALAGAGTLLETRLLAGGVDATAYAVKSANGINVMVVNKDTQQNLVLTIESGQTIQTATMQTLRGPGLAATSGVTIQGAMVGSDGSYAPAAAGTLTPQGTQTACLVPALSAGLISIS